MDAATRFATALLGQYIQLDTVKKLTPQISSTSPSIFLSRGPSEPAQVTVIGNELLQMNHPDYAACPQAVVPVLRAFLNEVALLHFLGPTELALPLRGFSMIAGFGCFSPRLFVAGDFSGTLYAALLLARAPIRASLDAYVRDFAAPMAAVLALLHARGVAHGCVSLHSLYVGGAPGAPARVGNFGGCAPSLYRAPKYHWARGPGFAARGDAFAQDIFGLGLLLDALIAHWLQGPDGAPERTRHWRALAARCAADDPALRPAAGAALAELAPGRADAPAPASAPILLPESNAEIDSISQLMAMFVDRSADNAGERVAPIDVAVVVGKFIEEDLRVRDRQARNAVIRTMSQSGPRSSLARDGRRERSRLG
jgi:hypothetical protein